ncbi:MAG TPA: hypothetical protein DDW91_02925 [Shewanella frigidimarina]|nr:hypothetical protein [Shewanella frigidimarina]
MADYKDPRPSPTDSAADPCVIYDNAVSFNEVINSDETVTTYTGKEIISLSQAIDKFGFGVAPFTFAAGGTLGSLNLLVSNSPTDGFLYKYVGAGSAPIAVAAGTDPSAGGDWQKFTAITASSISTLSEGSVQDALDSRPRFEQVIEGIEWESDIDATKTMLNWSNFQGQGKTKAEQFIPAILHDYTDAARTLQIDKVGGDIVVGDYILGLRRASNNVRRADKPSTYISDAGFLRCTYDRFDVKCEFTASISGTVMTVTAITSGVLAAGHYIRGGAEDGTVISSFGTGTGGTGTYNVTIDSEPTPQVLPSTALTAEAKLQVLAFYVGKNGDLGWAEDRVSMLTGYSGGAHAYTFRATNPAVSAIALFESSSGTVLSIQDTVGTPGTRTDLVAGINQTSGMSLIAQGGGINLEPKAGSNITVRGNIVTPSAQSLTITATGSTLQLNASGGIVMAHPAKLAPYSVATLPAAASFVAHTIYVTDGDAGQPCLAVSAGGVWKRIPLGAAVSAT